MIGRTNELYTNALRWLWAGVAVIPINRASKSPMVKWLQYKDRLPTMSDLDLWFKRWNANLGLVMGWRGLVVLDFDTMEAFDIWRMAYPEHLDTYTVKTRRGVHLYFHVPGWTRNFKLMDIDIKANGYVLAPPSVHPTGYVYQTINMSPVKQVKSIDDIIPAAMAMDTDVPYEYKHPILSEFLGDPWQTAMDPTNNPDESLIDRIKRAVRIENMFAEKDRNNGNYYRVRCPFHDDRNPSAWINIESQKFGCHVCNMKPMDVINLYARLNNLDNGTAIKELGVLADVV